MRVPCFVGLTILSDTVAAEPDVKEGASRSVGQPSPGDVEDLDIGSRPDEAFDCLTPFLDISCAASNNGHCDHGSLPKLLVINFGRTDTGPAVERANNRLNDRTLRLQRPGGRQMEVDTDGE